MPLRRLHVFSGNVDDKTIPRISSSKENTKVVCKQFGKMCDFSEK